MIKEYSKFKTTSAQAQSSGEGERALRAEASELLDFFVLFYQEKST